ncbi:MAG: hypothetical protein LAP21_08405 [Acidobacteriia bacterium]|nr:hypothetical protein [Terriglobia bacterium]
MFVSSQSRTLGATQELTRWQLLELAASHPFDTLSTIFSSGTDPQVLVNDRIRGAGIDPATDKFMSPVYAETFRKRYGINPTDSDAVDAWKRKAAAEVLAQYAGDYKKFRDEKAAADNQGIPWGLILGVGAAVLVGGVVVYKVVK